MIYGSRTEQMKQLHDPPSSGKAPKASGEMGQNQNDLWDEDQFGSGIGPGRGQRPKGLGQPLLHASVGLGEGCGGLRAATWRRPGARGCVLPGPRRTQDLRRRTGVQLKVRTGRSHRSAGWPAAACPSPAAHCGGTRARLRRPAVPSGAVRV